MPAARRLLSYHACWARSEVEDQGQVLPRVSCKGLHPPVHLPAHIQDWRLCGHQSERSGAEGMGSLLQLDQHSAALYFQPRALVPVSRNGSTCGSAAGHASQGLSWPDWCCLECHEKGHRCGSKQAGERDRVVSGSICHG